MLLRLYIRARKDHKVFVTEELQVLFNFLIICFTITSSASDLVSKEMLPYNFRSSNNMEHTKHRGTTFTS